MRKILRKLVLIPLPFAILLFIGAGLNEGFSPCNEKTPAADCATIEGSTLEMLKHYVLDFCISYITAFILVLPVIIIYTTLRNKKLRKDNII